MDTHVKVGLALVTLAAILPVARPDRAFAAPLTCESFKGPDCGGADGDAACGTGLECVETNDGCACQRQACCRCEGVTDADAGSCTVPCEDATLDDLKCAGSCFEAVSSGAACNLTVMVDKKCADGTCAPTGCCAVTINMGDQSPPIDACVMTDLVTCTTAPDSPGQFTAGGRCDLGILGRCVPTIPNGGSCASPAECQSGFCPDGVCCNTACTGPGEQCDLPGRGGICAVAPAPAPALAPSGLLVATTLLVGLAAFALRRRRSTP